MKEKIILDLGEEIEHKIKRKKNTYMDVFLDRRKRAVDFAVKRNNKSTYNYKKPSFYINELEGKLLEYNNDKKKDSFEILKKNILGEKKLMQNFNNDNLERKSHNFDNNIYNLKNKNKVYYETNNNPFFNNLKIERINIDHYITNENIKSASPPNKKNMKYFILNNKKESETNNDNIDKKESNIKKKQYKDKKVFRNKSNDNNLNYFDGKENHRFYDSSGVNDYYYNYESYKIKNKLKKPNEIKTENNSKLDNDKKRINEISPIKKELKIDYEDNNDFKSIENEYELRSLNKKILNRNAFDKKNVNLSDFNPKINRDKNEENKNMNSIKIIGEPKNTKNTSINQNSEKYEIEKEEKNKRKLILKNKKEISEIINEDIDLDIDKDIINNKSNHKFVYINDKKTKNNNIKINQNEDLIECIKNKDYSGIMLANNMNINVKNKDNHKNKKLKDFLLNQNKEKEPKIKNKLYYNNSSKEFSIQKIKNNIVNDIKDKINILRRNIQKSKENNNYKNEIYDYFLNEKQTNNKKNLILKEYYDKFFENNNDIDKKSDIRMKIKNKNKLIQSSERLQNKMNRRIFNERILNQGRNNNNNNISYNSLKFYVDKNELTKKRNKLNNDINLISDKSNDDLKLIDETGYEKFKLKNRNKKSSRSIIRIEKELKKFDLNNKNKFINKLDLIPIFTDNYDALTSPRNRWLYVNNKIMPSNEL